MYVLFQMSLLCKPNEIDVEISQDAPFFCLKDPLATPMLPEDMTCTLSALISFLEHVA